MNVTPIVIRVVVKTQHGQSELLVLTVEAWLRFEDLKKGLSINKGLKIIP